MSNMSYCRFQNTLIELRVCGDAIEEREKLSVEEKEARKWMIRLCAEILTEVGVDIDDHEVETAIKQLDQGA